MVGSEAVQAAMCQSVLYSRSLLRCASLREVRALLLLSTDNPETRQGCTPACILGKDQLTQGLLTVLARPRTYPAPREQRLKT